MYEKIYEYIDNDTLVYITFVVKQVGRKKKWAKILQIKEKEKSLLIYDVDSKTVGQLYLNQIDDITA